MVHAAQCSVCVVCAVTSSELFKLIYTTAQRVLSHPANVEAVHIEMLMNALVHLFDPEGMMHCSGVCGGKTDDEVLLRYLFLYYFQWFVAALCCMHVQRLTVIYSLVSQSLRHCICFMTHCTQRLVDIV